MSLIDLDDFSKKHVFRGHQYRDCSTLMPYPLSGSTKLLNYPYDGTSPEVLDLTDGSLSWPHPSSHSELIIPVTPQQILVRNSPEDAQTIICNVGTGKKERVLDHHAPLALSKPSVISKSRAEIFLGFDEGPAVAAYCLTEP